MVDIEVRALGALCQHFFLPCYGVVQEEGRVGNVLLQPFGIAHVLAEHLVLIHERRVVEPVQQKVGLVAAAVQLLPEYCGIEQVCHPDAFAVDLVGIGGPNAAAGGADLLVALVLLACNIQRLVVRRDDMSVLADQQAVRELDAAFGHAVHLLEQRRRIDYHAVADDAFLAFVQNARGDQVQYELVLSHDHGVARIMAALVARDHIGLLGEQIDYLSLAFVAPLGADNH